VALEIDNNDEIRLGFPIPITNEPGDDIYIAQAEFLSDLADPVGTKPVDVQVRFSDTGVWQTISRTGFVRDSTVGTPTIYYSDPEIKSDAYRLWFQKLDLSNFGFAPGKTINEIRIRGGVGPTLDAVVVGNLNSRRMPARNRDLNGDGMADVLWRHTTTGTVAVWLMTGAVVANVTTMGGAPTAWTIADVGDVNADGQADILWYHASTGTVAVWLMDGATVTSVASVGGAPVAWSVVGLGDVNGDGMADVLWRHTTTGTVAVWLMDGATVTSVASVGGAPVAWAIR
jgi:hypothetical protein